MNIRNLLMKLMRNSQLQYLPALCLGFGILVSGCGSDSSPTETSEGSANNGQIVIGLTDAEGDFLSYTVDVLSIKLTHANGNQIETLPIATTVDFAQYTDATEFLTAVRVPIGTYTRATMVLDYRNAQILVENAEGNVVTAVAVDKNGNALEQLEMEVQLSDSNRFIIAPGLLSHITLDFDLEASHQLDLNKTPAEAKVEPVLITDTRLDDPKSHRLRGVLNEVDFDASFFSVDIRPFYRLHGNFGNLNVHCNEETIYEINGALFSSTSGLEQLAQLPEGTPLIAHGELDKQEHRFTADHVLAGSSVPWGDKDIVSGHVIAREGNTLTLEGSILFQSANDHSDIKYRNTLTVLIGDDTRVTAFARNDRPFDKSDISVGQKVDVLGHLSGDMLDATQGHARLLPTQISGTVLQMSPLIIDLQTIGRHSPGHFNFTGTGNTEDANPNRYEIETSSLSLDNFEINARIKLLGFVNRFGEAPPDFTAHTAIDIRDLPALMRVHWHQGGDSTPFLSSTINELVIDLSADNLSDQHHVINTGHLTDLLALDSAPTLKVREDGKGIFIIIGANTTEVFEQFSVFESTLATYLNGITGITGIHSAGTFDIDTVTLTARIIIINMSD